TGSFGAAGVVAGASTIGLALTAAAGRRDPPPPLARPRRGGAARQRCVLDSILIEAVFISGPLLTGLLAATAGAAAALLAAALPALGLPFLLARRGLLPSQAPAVVEADPRPHQAVVDEAGLG